MNLRRQKQLRLIETKFSPYLESGFIQVVSATPDIYPTMSFALTKRTYGDSVDRVIWRSKQVIDYAFVYAAVKSQSEYHLALEDDVIVSRQFITAIQDFVELKKNEKWIALDFAKFYSIGILFHSRESPKIVQHLLLFYQDSPVDALLRSYIAITVSSTT